MGLRLHFGHKSIWAFFAAKPTVSKGFPQKLLANLADFARR